MATMMGSGVRLDSMIDVGFEFKPTVAVSARAFQTLDLDIRSFRVPLKRSIQQVLAPSIGRNFVANGRPDGWVPYAEDTLTMKANDPKNKYGNENMLRRSGLLWKTMQQYNIWTVTEKQAAILSLPDKVWYGQIHQAGYGMHASTLDHFASPAELKSMGGRGSTFIPARPFAMFQTEDMDRVQDVFSHWLQERIDARLAGIPAKSVR
jgi:phage gpG-like protein